jgi:hypothetical protein
LSAHAELDLATVAKAVDGIAPSVERYIEIELAQELTPLHSNTMEVPLTDALAENKVPEPFVVGLTEA